MKTQTPAWVVLRVEAAICFIYAVETIKEMERTILHATVTLSVLQETRLDALLKEQRRLLPLHFGGKLHWRPQLLEKGTSTPVDLAFRLKPAAGLCLRPST